MIMILSKTLGKIPYLLFASMFLTFCDKELENELASEDKIVITEANENADGSDVNETNNNGANQFSVDDFIDFIETERMGMVFVKDIYTTIGEDAASNEYIVQGNISDNTDQHIHYESFDIAGNTLSQTSHDEWFSKIDAAAVYGMTQTVDIYKAPFLKEFTADLYFPDALVADYSGSSIAAGNTLTWNADPDNEKGLILAFSPLEASGNGAGDKKYIHIPTDDGSYMLQASDVAFPAGTVKVDLMLLRGDYAEATSLLDNTTAIAIYAINGVQGRFAVP